jgi:hypothetical protein
VTIGKIDVSADGVNGMGVERIGVSCLHVSSALKALKYTLPSCQYRDSLASQVQNVPHYGRCLGLSTAGHFPASRLSAFAYLTQKSLSQAVARSFAAIVLVRYEESIQYIISEVKHRDCK